MTTSKGPVWVPENSQITHLTGGPTTDAMARLSPESYMKLYTTAFANKIAILARTAAVLALLCSLRLAADVVVTTSGARIVGKVTSISDGTINITTDYAGDIKVKQSLVASIETDAPVAVRLATGDRVTGTVTPTSDGKVKIEGTAGPAVAAVPQIAAIWAAGQEDPAVVALRRKWLYEAAVDINGESGVHDQLGTDMLFKATLKGPDDTLIFDTAYNRQVTNGQKSADQFKAGVDYSDNLSANVTWFVRDEAGFDRVNQITFGDIAAAGLGYSFIKAADQTLTGRAGLSFRDYQYAPAAGISNVNAVGADFELQYTKTFKTSQVSDKITFLPDFQDSKSYVLSHEFAYSVPIALSLWKLSIGVSNSYNSEPVPGIAKLDTLYFTRLNLTWGQK